MWRILKSPVGHGDSESIIKTDVHNGSVIVIIRCVRGFWKDSVKIFFKNICKWIIILFSRRVSQNIKRSAERIIFVVYGTCTAFDTRFTLSCGYSSKEFKEIARTRYRVVCTFGVAGASVLKITH